MLHCCLVLLTLGVFGPVSPEMGGPRWLKVEIAMGGDGFKCPFLTPMFMRILEEEGAATWVECKRERSEIEFCVPLESAQPQSTYTVWLTDLGYQESAITFLRFDTLTVQPKQPLSQ